METTKQKLKKLHIGGQERRNGWSVVDVLPGACVDIVADCRNLPLLDSTVAEIYASHVLEHLSYQGEVLAALREWHRVLVPAGLLRISVPDLPTLCRLYAEENNREIRFHLMRILYGGQTTPHDFHYTGFDWELLSQYLSEAQFSTMRTVRELGEFDDCSGLRIHGRPISLNIEARK